MIAYIVGFTVTLCAIIGSTLLFVLLDFELPNAVIASAIMCLFIMATIWSVLAATERKGKGRP